MLKLIKNATLVNEGRIYQSDVLIENQRIKKIAKKITSNSSQIINAKGLYLLPGIIDDQVHFREPGLTHKATIYTESKAAMSWQFNYEVRRIASLISMVNNESPGYSS